MATQVRQEQPAANAQLGLSCGQKALSDCTKLQPTRPRLVSLKQQVLSNCAEQNDGLAVKNGGLTMFNLIVCDWDLTSQKGTNPKENYNYGFHQEQHEYVYVNMSLPGCCMVETFLDICWLLGFYLFWDRLVWVQYGSNMRHQWARIIAILIRFGC